MSKYRTIAFLGRGPGLDVLQHVLLRDPRLGLVQVCTHRMKSRQEGGGERSDYPRFVEICGQAGVPLRAIEWAEARNGLGDYLPDGPVDLIFVLSWRSIIPVSVIRRASLGGINIHRGALPDYAGSVPVQRAIEAGESRVALTAHDLAPEVDRGQALAVGWFDIPPLPPGVSPEQHAETVKSLLLPFYAPLSRLAVDLRLAAGKPPEPS